MANHSYLPHMAVDREEMLATIGVSAVEDLFAHVPAQLRLKRPLALPEALSELELVEHMQQLAAANAQLKDYVCFLGAGAYDHYRPSVIDHVLGRSEFYTSYTQYQPEISQGYLQALWEYQSMICEITGMEVANASLYDGGTALAEAALMAAGITGRTEFVVASSVHPHYQAILETYSLDRGLRVMEVDYGDGVTLLPAMEKLVRETTAAVIIQNPNFFGCVEDIQVLGAIAKQQGALFIVLADPVSLGVLEAPGRLGADIVVGEGQGMGLPVSFGGPYLGFFATTEKLMRKMPGRIVGQTTDDRGNRGFVLTLQAREQHIRRGKATSNICSNEALCALAAAVYLSVVGKVGFQQVAQLSLQKAHYAYEKLTRIQGYSQVFSAPFFKEFVLKCSKPIQAINQQLLAKKIIGGLDLGTYYPELAGCMLVCVTEKRTLQQIHQLVSALEEII